MVEEAKGVPNLAKMKYATEFFIPADSGWYKNPQFSFSSDLCK